MPLPDYSLLMEKIPGIQQLVLPQCRDVAVSMLRLDQIHSQVSGNKLFKLRNYIDEAFQSEHKTILTFGGAFSNHLVATAYACEKLGLKSIGIVRGEAHEPISHSLKKCQKFGMRIHYLDRTNFARISFSENNESLHRQFGDFTQVPTGGYGPKGAAGASDILNLVPQNVYSHLCVAVGSGATVAGLLLRKRTEKIYAFPAIKGMYDIPERIAACGAEYNDRLAVIGDFHFGGFARKNAVLFQFMNEFFVHHKIPLDFVYTARMMYGVMNLIYKNHFPAGSHILCIHTGGLQGNASIESGVLSF